MVKLNDLQKHELRDWSDEVEEILRNLSEKAQIWRLLHMRNHDIFKRKYYWLIIPVTILSSVTGAANLALGSVASGNETVINLVIGALGIIISVISTLNNIFSFQRRKDEHFRAAKDWYRVQRMIDVELSLQRSKRNNVSIFFHLVLQEIERIHEFHPNIRDDVVRKFMKSYKNKKLSIDIPEILTIRKTLIFKDDLSSPVHVDNKIIVEPQNIIQNNIQHIDPNKVPNINPNLIPHINNNITVPIKKIPSYNRQGTFINMDDNDSSNKSDKNDSLEPSLLTTNTHTPESPKREERHSFLYNIGDKISNFTTKKIFQEKNINQSQIITENKPNNSPNISLTILEDPENTEDKIYDSDEGNVSSENDISHDEHVQYPFEIHHENLQTELSSEQDINQITSNQGLTNNLNNINNENINENDNKV